MTTTNTYYDYNGVVNNVDVKARYTINHNVYSDTATLVVPIISCNPSCPSGSSCVSGKCQCDSGKYACCFDSKNKYGDQYCCSNDNKCAKDDWVVSFCVNDQGSCWGGCSPNIGICQTSGGWPN